MRILYSDQFFPIVSNITAVVSAILVLSMGAVVNVSGLDMLVLSVVLLLVVSLLQAAMTTVNNASIRKFFIVTGFRYRQQIPCRLLFLPEEKPDRYTGKIKMLTHLIFEIILIGLFYIIREIVEEGKGWHGSRQLCHIFYLD